MICDGANKLARPSHNPQNENTNDSQSRRTQLVSCQDDAITYIDSEISGETSFDPWPLAIE